MNTINNSKKEMVFDMKKCSIILIIFLLMFALFGCKKNEEETISNYTITSQFISEYEVKSYEIKEYVITNDCYCSQYVISEYEIISEVIPDELLVYDIDWDDLLEKFAIGTSVIVITGILAATTSSAPIGYVFMCSFKEAVIDALVSTIIVILKDIINGYTTEGTVKKFNINDYADAFMWGAITGAVEGLITGTIDYCNPNNYFEGSHLAATKKDGVFYYNGNRVDSIEGVDGRTFLRFGSDYKEVLGNSVVDLTDDIFLNSSKNIKNISQITDIVKSGNHLVVEKGQVFNGIKTGTGWTKRGEPIGFLTKIGEVVDDQGKLLYTLRWTNSGSVSVLDDFVKISKKGVSFSSGVLDNAIEKIAPKVLKKYSDGSELTCISNVNLSNGKVGYICEAEKQGVVHRYLMDQNEKLICELSANNEFISGWRNILNSERCDIVKEFGQKVVELRKGGATRSEMAQLFDLNPKYNSQYGSTRDEVLDYIIDYIDTNGKIPPGWQGHHINNVMNNPQLAGELSNLKFYSSDAHLMVGHNGNFQNASSGNLTNIFSLITKYIGG